MPKCSIFMEHPDINQDILSDVNPYLTAVEPMKVSILVSC